MNRKKTILFISALDYWSMGEGKGGPALYKTIVSYATRDWNVYFITGNRGQRSYDYLLKNIHIIRFDATWLKRLTKIKKVGFFANILWWICFQFISFIIAQKILFKHKVDVVYGYEITGVPVAKIISILWNIPLVTRFQGTILGVNWIKRKMWKLRAWDHIVGLRTSADLVIMTNDGTRGDWVLQRIGSKTKNIRFWMNGVDWKLFSILPERSDARRQLGIASKYMLLTISRLVSWKRVDRAILAFPKKPEVLSNTMLVIVGDGPEREQLEKLAKTLGFEKNIRFEGAVPHKEIPNYLAAADIFLSLYDWSNVGNPLLEAMMAGKCIITLNNGDTARFIKNGVNGVLIEYDDFFKLPNVIEWLLDNEELRKRLGSNARKFAEENYWSWEERLNAEVIEVEKLIK